MSNPSVSFIMAARNAATTIRAAMESVLAQDYQGAVRLIVVDDASTDATSQIVSQYPQALLIRNEKQLGRSLSRNKALSHVDTDLIAIQDADDVSLPLRLADTVGLVGSSKRTVAGGQVSWIDPKKGSFPGGTWPADKGAASRLLAEGRMPLAHPTMIAPAEIMRSVGGYSQDYPVGEDLDLLIRIRRLYPDATFVNTPSTVCEYRRSEIDTLRYLVRSAYWRQKILAAHSYGSGLAANHIWMAESGKGYVRQRVKLARNVLRNVVKR